MKLAYHNLESHLAKTLAPMYLLSGDELLLIQEAIDLIRKAAHRAGFIERNRIDTDTTTEWGHSLLASAHMLSLFSNKQILELDLRHAKSNQANNKALQQYAENSVEDTLLIIQTNKLDAKSQATAWYKTIEKKGVTIQVWPISLEQLPAWLIQRGKKNNLQLSKEAANYLATHTEGNLIAAVQTLEKLALLNPNGIVDDTLITHILEDDAHFSVFDLIESILIGNSKRSLRILQALAAEHTEPTLILWAIARELRIMADIIKQTQQGIPLSSLFNQFRIWEKRQASVRAFIKQHSVEQCWAFLLTAAKLDRIIKGAQLGDIWNELEQFILKLTGNAIIERYSEGEALCILSNEQ